MTITNEC